MAKSVMNTHTKKHLLAQVLFSVIFALRRVLLLRSDIRLTPSGIRFASFGGEYNITAERSGAISLLRSKNITLTKSAYNFFEIFLFIFLYFLGILL